MVAEGGRGSISHCPPQRKHRDSSWKVGALALVLSSLDPAAALHSEPLFFGSFSRGGDGSVDEPADPISQGCTGVADEGQRPLK